MPNINAWLGYGQERAEFDPGSIIDRDRVDLVIARGAVDLPAQCVRVVPVRVAFERGQSPGNNQPAQAAVDVIGDDTLDIRRGDLFEFRGGRYKVIYVESAIPGQIQARAEGTQ